MSLVIQSVRPNHFSKELLKFIFYEIRFHKIYMNKSGTQGSRCSNLQSDSYKL